MYDKLIGCIIKAVFTDGSSWSVVQGELLGYDESLKMISVQDDKRCHEVLINVLKIDKLEVIEEKRGGSF